MDPWLKVLAVFFAGVILFCGIFFLTDGSKNSRTDSTETELPAENAGEKTIDWLVSLELPEGYTLGDYDELVGFGGGALIEPKAYEIYGEENFCPEEWMTSGVIAKISDAGDEFVFENGEIIEKTGFLWNHSTEEKIETLEGMDKPAVLSIILTCIRQRSLENSKRKGYRFRKGKQHPTTGISISWKKGMTLHII